MMTLLRSADFPAYFPAPSHFWWQSSSLSFISLTWPHVKSKTVSISLPSFHYLGLFPDLLFSLPQTFTSLDLLRGRKDSSESCVMLIASWFLAPSLAGQGDLGSELPVHQWLSDSFVWIHAYSAPHCRHNVAWRFKHFASPFGENFHSKICLHLKGY